MPTKIKLWKCDICGAKYKSKKAAGKCEAHGVPEILYKVGDRFRFKTKKEWRYGSEETIEIVDSFIAHQLHAGHVVRYIIAINDKKQQRSITQRYLERKIKDSFNEVE